MHAKEYKEKNINLWKEFYLDKIDSSWQSFFQIEREKKYFFILLEEVENEYKNFSCWPLKNNIFRLFREISLERIKVIILGQDPYHQKEIADGIAFSTQKKNYIPPSLKNIFFELKKDTNFSPLIKFKTISGNLLPWVKEGVFLINTILTVRENSPLSHEDIWKEFTFSLFKYLKEYDGKLIWVFWGNKAKNIKKIHSIKDEYSLSSSHPSPFNNKLGNFLNSKPFSNINKMLEKLKRKKINWLIIFN